MTDETPSDEPSGWFPMLLAAALAARFLGLSRSAFYRLDKVGLVPRPVRLGKLKYWPRPELRRWVESGCPPRHDWEKQK